VKPRIAWLAAKGADAHAQLPGAPRALCGARALDPKFAWPIVTRCATCTAAVTAIAEGRTPPAPVRAG
jgi:hypothetical protein